METILIADHDTAFLNALAAGLKEHKGTFRFLAARDGEEAIEIMKRKPVSVLVTDLHLPKVNGFGLLTHARETYPDMLCIVMADQSTPPQIRDSIKKEVLAFMEKPFEADMLARTILNALNEDHRVLDAAAKDTASELNRTGGFLRGISTGTFLQMVEMEEKTCLLEVSSPDGKKGFFYFRKGELFDAVYGDLKGKEAAMRMIPLERAKIRILKAPEKKIRRRIDEGLMGIIMDAMRLKDETWKKVSA